MCRLGTLGAPVLWCPLHRDSHTSPRCPCSCRPGALCCLPPRCRGAEAPGDPQSTETPESPLDSLHDRQAPGAEGHLTPLPSSMGEMGSCLLGRDAPVQTRATAIIQHNPHSVSQLGCPNGAQVLGSLPRAAPNCPGTIQSPVPAFTALTSLSLIQDHWTVVHGDTPTTGLQCNKYTLVTTRLSGLPRFDIRIQTADFGSCGTQPHSLLG